MNKFYNFLFKYRFITFLLIIILISDVITVTLDKLDILQKLQRSILDVNFTDFYYSSDKPYRQKPDSNIVIINVQTNARPDLADLINLVNEHNPAVIGCDVFFSQLKNDSAGDIKLSRALSKVKNLVMAAALYSDDNYYSFDKIRTSHPLFTANANTGFVNLNIPEEDRQSGKVRSFNPSMTLEGKTYYHFAVQVAKLFNEAKAKNFLNTNHGTAIINFTGQDDYLKLNGKTHGGFSSFDFEDLRMMSPGKRDSLINNKIILLGFTGDDRLHYSLEDNFYSPLNKVMIGYSVPDMYGVTIHANAIAMILNGNYIYYNHMISLLTSIFLLFLSLLLFDLIMKKWENQYQVISKVIALILINIIILTAGTIFEKYFIKIDIRYVIFYLVLTPDIYDFLYSNIRKKIRMSPVVIEDRISKE